MQFVVPPAELLNAAGRCRNTNAQVQDQITRMQNYVHGLMGSYTGTAAQALQALSDQWGRDATVLNHVLTTIAEGLTSNAHNYSGTEGGNATNLLKIANALPAGRF